jgi:hypothetical protein
MTHYFAYEFFLGGEARVPGLHYYDSEVFFQIPESTEFQV